MAGRKGRSGRKKTVSTLINEALERLDQHIPELFDKLIEKGLQGDRECLIYLLDRRLGKPKVVSDVTLEGGAELGRVALLNFLKLGIEAKKQFEAGEIEIEPLVTPLLEEGDS